MVNTQDAFLPPFSGAVLLSETKGQRGIFVVCFFCFVLLCFLQKWSITCFRKDAVIYYLFLLPLWPESSKDYIPANGKEMCMEHVLA